MYGCETAPVNKESRRVSNSSQSKFQGHVFCGSKLSIGNTQDCAYQGRRNDQLMTRIRTVGEETGIDVVRRRYLLVVFVIMRDEQKR